MWIELEQYITQATGQPFSGCRYTPVGGGSINQAYCLQSNSQRYFVKLNAAHKLSMFAAEAAGLLEMEASKCIRVPHPITTGVVAEHSFIVLEWIDLGRGTPQTWYTLGQQLAQMHTTSSPRGFGWHQSNTIGDTPQLNSWTADWATFFAEHRIGYQLRLARHRGGRFSQGAALQAAIPQLLANHHPQPALVHGDLWSGNAAFTAAGEPIILDPAPYYGDREVDVAMTELFGGFPAAFYEGYQQTFPLPPGYQHRRLLYNLYHILNHFNLFGGGYGGQAERMIETLLASI
ncbi:phosphotransferase [Synechococcales cyanobacterium C]|uniref:Phosphotransferase n=1 Tax=Petrachloros mirabilis ULC683 TaxID=2781853 RepID=A0A8K1ZZI4_9CYAN|nr:fructosamine kinase family protein [Petrachloros mirabilis]NCJ07698.1 phosphotransferase [Petrachloros mirabilis ULC683]